MTTPKSGKLGKVDIAAAATNYPLYTCPEGMIATGNIRLCNRNGTVVKVRVSVGAAVPGNADYLDYDVSIPANGVLEDTAIVVDPLEVVVVRSDTAGVSARIHGFERVQ